MEHVFQVLPHHLELLSQYFQSCRLLGDLLGELALRCILDISKQVLNTDFFSLCSSNGAWHVHELSVHVSFRVDFFTREVCLCGQTNLRLLLNIAHNKEWIGVVPSQNLIDMDVSLLDLWAARVPANDLLAAIDTAHHVVHLLVVDVVKEPHIWLLQVFLKGNCIAIGDI